MKSENMLLFFAIAAVLVSFINLSISLTRISEMSKIAGYATSGSVNLSVSQEVAINFTDGIINWGSGVVNTTGGCAAATLNTSAGTVACGNWTAETSGFTIVNTGNINITLDLAAVQSAANFIGGGSGTIPDPYYMWNISNIEAASCINTTAQGWHNFTNVNTTSPGTRWCSVFGYLPSSDSIRIDIAILVPEDSKTGALNDTITATATAI